MRFMKLSLCIALSISVSQIPVQASHEEVSEVSGLTLSHGTPQIMLDIIKFPSENFSKTQEGEGVEIMPRAISVSCMGTELCDSLQRLTKSKENGGDGISTHFFIPALTGAQIRHHYPDLLEGKVLHHPDQVPVFQLVSENIRAWHAGVSRWGSLNALEGCAAGINSCALGVHFHTPGYANGDGSDWFKFTPYGAEQMKTGGALLKVLMDRHAIDGRNLVAYGDIQEGRTAPGPLFDWRLLANEFDVGYVPTPLASYPLIEGDVNTYVEEALQKIGYHFDTPKLGVYVNKFRMRFMGDTWQGMNQEIDEAFLRALVPTVAFYTNS